MTAISGIIVAHNHAHHMVDCINSLRQVCDDVIVIDQGSTDGTKEMARAMGAMIVEQDYVTDEIGNWAYGIPLCKHAWILAIYPHERIDDDLATLLDNEDLDELKVNLIGIARKTYLGGRFLRLGGFYPNFANRLFNKEKINLSNMTQNLDGTEVSYAILEAHLICYTYEDYSDFFKQMLDVEDEVDELHMKQRHPSMWQSWVYAIGTFFWIYIFRLSFLMGMDGLTVAVCKAVRRYLVLSRLIENRHATEWSRRKNN